MPCILRIAAKYVHRPYVHRPGTKQRSCWEWDTEFVVVPGLGPLENSAPPGWRSLGPVERGTLAKKEGRERSSARLSYSLHVRDCSAQKLLKSNLHSIHARCIYNYPLPAVALPPGGQNYVAIVRLVP